MKALIKAKNLIIALILPILCGFFLFGCNNDFYFPKEDENFEKSVIYAIEYLTGEIHNDSWGYEVLKNTKNDYKINFEFSYYNVYTSDGELILGESVKENQGDIILQYKGLKKTLIKNEKIFASGVEIFNNFIENKLVRNDLKNNKLSINNLYSFLGVDSLIKQHFGIKTDDVVTNQLNYTANVYFTFENSLTFEEFYNYYNEKSHYGITHILVKTGDNEDSVLLQLDSEKYKAATQTKLTKELQELVNLDIGGFESIVNSSLFNVKNTTPESILNYIENNNNIICGFILNNIFPISNSYFFYSAGLYNNTVNLSKFIFIM